MNSTARLVLFAAAAALAVAGLIFFLEMNKVNVETLDYIFWLQRKQISPPGVEPKDYEAKFKQELVNSGSPLYETSFAFIDATGQKQCHEINQVADSVKTEAVTESGESACDLIKRIDPDAVHVSQWILFKDAASKEAFEAALGL
jgi:hypothetical protein